MKLFKYTDPQTNEDIIINMHQVKTIRLSNNFITLYLTDNTSYVLKSKSPETAKSIMDFIWSNYND